MYRPEAIDGVRQTGYFRTPSSRLLHSLVASYVENCMPPLSSARTTCPAHYTWIVSARHIINVIGLIVR